ncbi:Isochorismatase domain-containing protein [Balamuthia mandrillaris]
MEGPASSSTTLGPTLPFCLVLIDLQNDFFSPSGFLKESHMDASPLLSPVLALRHYTETHGAPVVWVKADYSQARHVEEQNRGLTHTGQRACCVAGTFGAELCATFGEPSPKDLVVNKRWYSALKDEKRGGANQETLSSFLNTQSGRLNHLVLCGVMAHVCVKHTALDALQQGYQVSIVSDATASLNSQQKLRALEELRAAGAAILPTAELTKGDVTRP